MSVVLYLVRHGIAFDAAPGMRDFDRELTPQGARRITRAAHGLRRLGVRPDAVLASPLPRAVQTAERLQKVLCPNTAVEIYNALAPGHGPVDTMRGLSAVRGASAVMLVGHQPDMGELAGYLLSHGGTSVWFEFKKGAVAAIEVSALPPRSPGILRWFMTSRHLRAIASPRPRP